MKILLIGKSGSGKSSVAKYIQNKYNYRIMSLGDKVKQVVYLILRYFDIPINGINDLYDTTKKETYRKYLQFIGTDIGRNIIGENVWCNAIFDEYAASDDVVIDDIRFRNELEIFNDKSFDTLVIRIKRIGENNYDHISEKELEELPYDELIINDGDLKELYKAVDDIMAARVLNKSADQSTHDIENTIDPHNTKVSGENIENLIEIEDEITNSPDHPAQFQLSHDISTMERLSKCVPDISNIQIQHAPNVSSHDINSFTSVIKTLLNPNEPDTKITLDPDNPFDTTTSPLPQSSYQKGEIGEHYVYELLQRIKPSFETTMVSKTGHMCDIHSIDHANNITYIFEIKLKQTITMEDINKFTKDINTLKTSTTNSIFGIFLSLNSERIVTVGKMGINDNLIYLSKDYITSNVLEIIFEMVPLYRNIIQSRPKIEPIEEFTIPANIITIIVQLRAQYENVKREREIYDALKTNSEENLNYIQELINTIIVKEQFIKALNSSFAKYIDGVSTNVTDQEEQNLIEYINNTPRNKIKKSDILNKFPLFKTKLGGMKLKDIIEMYKI